MEKDEMTSPKQEGIALQEDTPEEKAKSKRAFLGWLIFFIVMAVLITAAILVITLI